MRGSMEEISIRPAAGQVNADTTSCFAKPCTDLEQLSAQSLNKALRLSQTSRAETIFIDVLAVTGIAFFYFAAVRV